MKSVLFELDSDTQSIKELWKSINRIADGRVFDNEIVHKFSEEYPLGIRIRQLAAVKVLVETLELSHSVMESEESEQ